MTWTSWLFDMNSYNIIVDNQMDDDHIPLKDEFSNDESDIDLGEKESENNNGEKEG